MGVSENVGFADLLTLDVFILNAATTPLRFWSIQMDQLSRNLKPMVLPQQPIELVSCWKFEGTLKVFNFLSWYAKHRFCEWTIPSVGELLSFWITSAIVLIHGLLFSSNHVNVNLYLLSQCDDSIHLLVMSLCLLVNSFVLGLFHVVESLLVSDLFGW